MNDLKQILVDSARYRWIRDNSHIFDFANQDGDILPAQFDELIDVCIDIQLAKETGWLK